MAKEEEKDAVSMEAFLKLMRGKSLRVASNPARYIERLAYKIETERKELEAKQAIRRKKA